MGLLRPQIFTTERALTSFVTQPGARVAAMIGTAVWGPINQNILVGSLSEFISLFGDDKSGVGVSGIKGADLFFRNGGVLKFVRIEDGTAAEADTTFTDNVTNQLTFTAKFKGSYGNNIRVTISANSINAANVNVSITDGQRTENFTNAGQGYADSDDIVTAVNDSVSGSVLVVAEVHNDGDGEELPDAGNAFLSGGLDGETGTLTTAINNAYDNVLEVEEFNFLLIPGNTDNAIHATIVGKLNNRDNTEKLYSRFITGVALNEPVNTTLARTASGKRITIVAPNTQYNDRVTGNLVTLDGSYLACAYAGLLCRIGVQISGTHETVNVPGLSINTTTNKQFYTKTEQEQLLQARILPISKIGNSIQAVRGVTREPSTTSIYFDEVVVDITDFIRASVENYLNTAIGKPNTEARRKVWSSGIDSILETAKRNEIIQEYDTTSIIVGASPDTFIATVNVKPSYSVNFINLNININ